MILLAKKPKNPSQHDWYYTNADPGTFRHMVHTLRQEKKGVLPEDDFRKAAQTPMKQRKARLLAKIQAKGEGGLSTNSINFFEPVLGKLIKDGDVVLKRTIFRSGFHGANRTSMVATWFPEVVEEHVHEPYAKKNAALKEAGMRVPGENQGTERVETRVVKWNKKKEERVLFETLKGTADMDVLKEVNRTKTKFRKMRIPKDEGNDE